MSRVGIAFRIALAAMALGVPARAQPAGEKTPAAPQAAAPRAGKLTKPPKLKEFVPAPYPEVQGEKKPVSVMLEIGIAADGTVSEVTVLESAGAPFDEASRAAALKFSFEPAEIDGKPAPVKIKYRYDLNPEPAQAPSVTTTAEFSGGVRDSKTKQPLAGVIVELDTGESAKTDADGHFSFTSVTPGKHAVSLTGKTFTPISTEETLEPGKRYEATYDIDVSPVALAPEERSDFEVVIVVTKLEKEIVSTSVSAEQGSRVAGTGGDVVKVVENLPGVARATVGSGALIVWGASAEDTRVYVDDVHIPALYHQGGFRSVVHSDLVRSVELQPGGYGASHGRGLGGLVMIGLKPLDEQGSHGSLQVDAIDAAASVRTRISDHWAAAAAARRSHLDWVLGKVTSEDVGDFVPIPRYWDAQARVAWMPRDKESLEAGALLSSDRIDRNLLAADPAETKRESKSSDFQRVYLRYRRETANGLTLVTPWFGIDSSEVVSRFGEVPTLLKVDGKLYGMSASWRGKAEDWLAVGVGLDTEIVYSAQYRAGSVTTPPREGDIRVFGQLPSDQINADDWNVTIASLGAYVEGDAAAFGGKLHVIPGFRMEPSVVRTSRITPPIGDVPPVGSVREDTGVEPRLALRFMASDRVSVKAAVGVYHQPPLAEDLSSVFGNPLLGPARATHYLAGANYQLSKPLALELTGFYSRSYDLAVRSPLPSPALARGLLDQGEGRAYGSQFLLRHDLVGRFFGWASLSIIHSERTDAGTNAWRPFDFDQTYVFTAVGSYDLGAGFEIGSRFRYSTGYPRTPVIDATYDSRVDAYQPMFGAHNAIRIPSFYALDARLSKKFNFHGPMLELYLDVQNVTNHANPEEIVYNFDYSKRSYITGLPILPVVGAKFTW